MLPPTKQEFSKDSSFHFFPQLAAEIRNYTWEISVKDYPARIVDLREYRQPISRASVPQNPLAPKSLQELNSYDFRSQEEIYDTKEIVGFKSRAIAPTVLYVC